MDRNNQPTPRLQLGKESMVIQGFPIHRVPNLVANASEHLLTSLAGNMMASTVPLALMACLFESLQWNFTDPGCVTSQEEVDDAMQMFNLCAGLGPCADAEDEESHSSTTKSIEASGHGAMKRRRPQ